MRFAWTIILGPMQSGMKNSMLFYLMMMMIKWNPSFAGISFLLWAISSSTYATSSKEGTHMLWHMILMLRTRGNPQISISYWNVHRPKAKRKKEKNVSLHHAPTASSARPHPTACGWIVVSWRWTWSIRSINRDYCNPRGQKEGTGPLRVHTTNTSSGQIWARMANIRAQEAAISPKEWTQTLTSILHED